jgi:hypothetical protein
VVGAHSHFLPILPDFVPIHKAVFLALQTSTIFGKEVVGTLKVRFWGRCKLSSSGLLAKTLLGVA